MTPNNDDVHLNAVTRTAEENSPAAPQATGAELTPPNSAGAQGTLAVREGTMPRSSMNAKSFNLKDPFISNSSSMESNAVDEAPQPIAESPAKGPAPREDRLAEPLSADNAQARLPPQACVFVANLSNQRTDLQLQEALETIFNGFGTCYAKIRRDKNKMPMAFVSFHEVEHARAAVRDSKGMIIDGRTIRAEHAKADRTILLTRHSGGAIPEGEAHEVLDRFGAIEETSAISVADQKIANLPEGRWVKFAYPQDCFDAQFAFRNHDRYRLVDHHVGGARPQYRSVSGPSFHRDPAQPTYAANSILGQNAVVTRNTLLAPTATPAENDVRVPRDLPEDCSVYVGNLPADVTKEQLCEYFHKFGEVRDAQVRRRPYPNTDRLNTFAFVCFEDPQTAQTVIAANLVFGDHDIRVERKEHIMRRRMREQRSAYARHWQDSAFVSLYHQALQLGLSQAQAEQILNMGRLHRYLDSYGDPSLPPQAAEAPHYHPAGATCHLPQYRPQNSAIGYHHSFEAPRPSNQHSQYRNLEPTSSTEAQFMFGGTTYYHRHDPSSQAVVQHQAYAPIEPTCDTDLTFSYGMENYPTRDFVPSFNRSQIHYSDESYGHPTYVDESYPSEPFPSQTNYHHHRSYY